MRARYDYGLGALFAALLYALAASAQMPVGTFVQGPAVAAGFTGPGDITTFTVFYSMGCYKNGYTGKAFQLFRDSDSATMDVSCNGSGLANQSSTAMATWCSGTTCRAIKLYNQVAVGTCDLTTTISGTGANPINVSGLNSQPDVNFPLGNVTLNSSCSPSNSTPSTAYVVSNSNSAVSGFQNVFGDTGANIYLGYDNATTMLSAETSGSSVSQTVTGNVWLVSVAVMNAGSSSLTVNGSAASGNDGTARSWAGYEIGAVGSSCCFYTGLWVEAGFISGTALGSTTITSLTNNVRSSARWNF